MTGRQCLQNRDHCLGKGNAEYHQRQQSTRQKSPYTQNRRGNRNNHTRTTPPKTQDNCHTTAKESRGSTAQEGSSYTQNPQRKTRRNTAHLYTRSAQQKRPNTEKATINAQAPNQDCLHAGGQPQPCPWQTLVQQRHRQQRPDRPSGGQQGHPKPNKTTSSLTHTNEGGDTGPDTNE